MYHLFHSNYRIVFRDPVLILYLFLVFFNGISWVWAFTTFHHTPLLLGTCFLAYSFGLRHAVDIDHIVAIDNITRKLIDEHKNPVGTGLFFSLGHSTIVYILTIILIATTFTFQHRFEDLKLIGEIVGTLISSLFLVILALINIGVFLEALKNIAILKQNPHGGFVGDSHPQGFISRLLKPLFKVINKNWQIYGIGLLFGLGFDTATEIGLLGLSAKEASEGLNPWSILVFPTLFSAGMALIDSLDGVLMVKAYGWAFIKPLKKLYYNLIMTFISILTALFIGIVEIFEVVADHSKVNNLFWTFIHKVNDNFEMMGFLVIVVFILCWFLSFAFFRHKELDT